MKRFFLILAIIIVTAILMALTTGTLGTADTKVLGIPVVEIGDFSWLTVGGWVAGWVGGWLVGWLAGWLGWLVAGWLAGWLVPGWLVGPWSLVGWLVPGPWLLVPGCWLVPC